MVNKQINSAKESTLLTITHNEFLSLLQKQIEEGKKLQETTVAVYDSPNPFRNDGRDRPVDEAAYEAFYTEYNKWNGFNTEMLKRSFTNDGGEYLERYNTCGQFLAYTNINQVDFLKSLIKKRIDELQTLETQLKLIPVVDGVKEEEKEKTKRNMNQIFVVYGHDKQMKLEVEAFLKNELNLDVIALDEQPNHGKTIIEKLEHYSKNAGYAVILMSPDDTMEVDGQIYKQARQNVVLELGYFMAKLGRSNVCVILKEDVEKPSDISGVLHLPFKENWQYKLQKELKAADVECHT